ncbi:tape measure protein [Phocaeicola vulgatus]|uniref:tape measure protein n=1 Tax=Phocaeicola vulgatus TaxID=821 RepID=UPI00189B82D4|nr:tape measure protein [Phocaeicola vulgatus]MDB0778333.1 tape measure protein [Phocaeicola vulgatus]MDB0783725.1 tape measure protein [Phocaeicola vulgatus]MDB0816601.1 tape measure protein [Phocaeicola vulgatus]MDB0828543.1 tape measure protein [Phocaeicola vulgatus]MDB0833785.1 tape measure protein [Phocaeicola vulgatus]
MSKLYFKIGSDWEEVVRLRNEIAKLKQELMSMDGTQTPAAFKALNAQLAASNQRLDELVTNAAKAGAEMETGFKRKIFDASQVVNGLSEKITFQRGTIQQLKNELSGLKDKYREALKQDGDTSSLEAKIRSTNEKLKEQKSSLFNLTQEQANARLSVKKLRDEYALYRQDGEKNVDVTKQVEQAMSNMGKKLLGGYSIKEFLSSMIRVRGEFQSMQTAIETMVGKDMAGQLIPQIKELAKISPLTMSDMVGAEKMMLGFNIQAEDTIKYLKAISDISMGESSKFNSLTLAFSQMSAAGKLMGQDLNQMINAGFNPLQIISEKTGKSIATLKDEMSKGAVSAEMVQQAFIDATSAGGKFYNMSENASKTINGQLSMMQDALDSVFNELGTKSESVIMDGIQMTTSLIQNYETVGKILAGLVVTYGTYRTAVMLVTAAESKHTLVEIGLTNARLLARKAQLALNAAMLTNPYVALTVVIGGLATTMWAMSDSTTAAARAQKEYNGIKDAAFKKEQEHKLKIEELLTAARDESLATLTRQKSLEELRKEYPKIFEQYDIEKLKLEDILKLKQKINEEDSRRSVQGRRDDYNALKQTITNQRRYLQLFDNPDLRKNMSDSDKEIWKMFSGNQSYVQVREQMEKNSKLLKKYQKDMFDDNISAYKSNLKNYSKEKLETELKLAQSSASKRNGFVVNGMMVKGGDLESVISSINGALAKKKSPTTYKQDYEKAKKDWDDAKKKLSEIEKDKSKFTSKLYEEAKKRVETTEKAYKNLGGITGSSLTKQEKAAEKQKKEQKKTAEQLLSLHRQNQQDEINLMREGTEKKLKQIDLDYQKQIDAIRKQEEEWSKAGNGKLTDKQAQKISEAYTNAESMRDKDISDVTEGQLKAEQQALNDYLKEYGTFQQQKLAIAQEYAEKIRKAQEENGVNSAQVKLLEKQRDVAIQNKETEAIKANIDWVTVFGEFGSMFSDMIKPALDEAKKYVRTDKFKNSDQASQKSLIDAISQMEKSLGGTSGVNFKKLGEDVKAYQIAEQNRISAIGIETAALERLKKSQDDYTKAQKGGTESEKQAAANALETARQNADIASANVKTQTDIANQAQQNVSDTATKLKASMENILGGLQQLSSGGLYDAYSGIIKTVNGFKDVIGKTSESLKEVPIVGWILSIIDVLKDGLSNLVGGLLDAVLNAVSGIIGDVLSGDLFVTIGRSLRDGIGNILNAISFGGFNSLFGIGGNAKEVQETIDRLTNRNETLQTAIEDLTDEMKASRGMKSVESYKEAVKYQEEVNKNYLQIAKEQAGYHKSHGSWQHYLKWTDEMLEHARKATGMQDFSGTDSLWNLTPEQMKALRSDVWLWDIMESSGKGGYGERVTDKLDDYIEQAGKLEELTDSLYEGLIGMSFDSMYDSFVSSLMDMEKSAEDFADDISKYFMQAMLSNAIGEQFSDKLRAWYDKFGEAMKDDGTLDNNERKELMDEYMGYVDEAMKLRDELAAATGYDKISQESTSQSASSKGFQEMSQDTGEGLNGRFTALQIAGEEIKNQNIIQSQSLNLLTVKADALLSIDTETRNIADDTRDLIAQSYLELVQISENTGAIVKPIQQMQRDIAEVKKNTAKL